MKHYLIAIIALVLAISLSAFTFTKNQQLQRKAFKNIEKVFGENVGMYSYCVFEYMWGPHDDPESYIKVPYFEYIINSCPGNTELCAIYAEEDLMFNPGHPTQQSLNYLITYYGFYNYFAYETPGLIEFKWVW